MEKMWQDRNDKLRELCRKLAPVIGKEKAEKLWQLYVVEDEQGRKDMALEIELIAEKHLKQEPLKEPILLEPPSPVDSAGLFLLGDVVYNDKKLHKLYLSPEDFVKQIGIYSMSGEGKTRTAMLLALQLLKFRIPFLVIDSKKSWRNLLRYKGKLPGPASGVKNPFSIEDILVLSAGRPTARQFDWNPLKPPANVDYMTWLSVLVKCLERSHLGGLGVGDFIFRIFQKRMGQMKDTGICPNFVDGMHELSHIREGGRAYLWQQSTKRIFRDLTAGPSARAFNARKPIVLEELFTMPVIIEVDSLSEYNRVLLKELFVRYIHMHRMNSPKSRGIAHVLFLEELHTMPGVSKKEENEGKSSLGNVYREIREYQEGIVSLDQHVSLLGTQITGNAHCQIYLGMTHTADIKAAAQGLYLSEKEQEYLNRIKVGEAVVKVKNRVNPCLVRIEHLPLSNDEVTDEELKNRQGFSRLSSLESAKNEDFGHFPAGDNNRSAESPESVESVRKLLADINEQPLSSLVKRYERLGLSMRKGNEAKRKLVADGLIVPRTVITKTTQMVLFELTEKSRASLRDFGHHVEEGQREGIVHRFWKSRIADYYRNRECEVLVEEHVNGKPDVIAMRWDGRVAIEIETGASDVLGNIEKNIKAGFQEIVCVATTRELEEKVKLEVRERGLQDKVRVTSVFEFDVN